MLYVIHPNRRATAQALMIFVQHVFGNLIAPVLIGWVCAVARTYRDYTAHPDVLFQVSDSLYDKYSREYAWFTRGDSLEWAMYLNVVVLYLGAVTFYFCSNNIESDRWVPSDWGYSLSRRQGHDRGACCRAKEVAVQQHGGDHGLVARRFCCFENENASSAF